MEFIGSNFSLIYEKSLESVQNNGVLVGKLKTLPHYSCVLTNPIYNLVYMKKNWAWCLVEGINRLSFEKLNWMNPGTAYKLRPRWKTKLEKEGGTFDYSYGELYRFQIDSIKKVLKRKSEREAIMTVWDITHLIEREKFARRPCTLTLHFVPINGALHCHVTMRTMDIVNMMPYDIFHHTLLQRLLATECGYSLGEFSISATTVYYQKKRDNGNIDRILEGLQLSNIIQLGSLPIIKHDTESWSFTELDRQILSSLAHEMDKAESVGRLDELMTDIEILDFSSNFSKNYANAMLYCYYKLKFKLEDTRLLKSEFKILELT